MAIGTDIFAGATKYGSLAGGAATIGKLFKEFYLPATRDLLNNKRILTRYMRKNTEDVAGKFAVISLNVGRNEGVGFIDEGAKLPDPGKQAYDRAEYEMRYNYGRILFTGPSQASSRTDRGAFLRIMDSEIRGIARDMQVENNRVMFGDGSGRLAQVDGTTGTQTVIAVKNPGGFANLGGGTQYLRSGMRIAFVYDNAGVGAMRAAADGSTGFKISSVDYSAHTITLAEAVTGLTGAEYLVRVSQIDNNSTAGGLPDSGWINEPFGLFALVNDADPYQGYATDATARPRDMGNIDSATNDWWQAFVIDNGGSPMAFNQDLLQQLADGIDIKSDGTIGMFMTTHGLRRQYANQIIPNKRWSGNVLTLDGGWRALSYDEIPIVVDKDCTRGLIYGLDFETLMCLMETDYEWMDADGSVLHRLPDNDAYQATLYRYWECATDARNRNGRIEDLQDT